MNKDEFEELWVINPDGNKHSLYTYLQNIFEENRTAFDGTLITLEFIIKKYKEYSLYWDTVFSDRDPKFISAKDKKKNISAFMVAQMYEQTFAIPSKKRDKYLFGNFSDSSLKNKLNEFLNLIGHVNNTEKATTTQADKPF